MLLTSNKDCIVSNEFIHLKKRVYIGSFVYLPVQLPCVLMNVAWNKQLTLYV
jgi:hypothetical protein